MTSIIRTLLCLILICAATNVQAQDIIGGRWQVASIIAVEGSDTTIVYDQNVENPLMDFSNMQNTFLADGTVESLDALGNPVATPGTWTLEGDTFRMDGQKPVSFYQPNPNEFYITQEATVLNIDRELVKKSFITKNVRLNPVSIQSTPLDDVITSKIFPNPSKDEFTVEINGDATIASVSLFDNKHSEIKAFGSGFSSMDIGTLSKGLYIVVIKLTDGHYLVEKLVKR